ncbi:hypothetical protein FNYG_14230 [Fusarium nygamai]|uniref:Uncharacterized protein n=1 Tax=Gibberella nygamai TaxID=42673 RepID=A0A2K0UTP9_GIBNY|nr:hypothetical protein FNYG_14230 [Fusarium nygamai]
MASFRPRAGAGYTLPYSFPDEEERCMVQEKEPELEDKDTHMSNLGYKQLFKNAQRQLEDMRHRYRESQMLVSKYEEKNKQLQHQLLQSQVISNRALTVASQTQDLLNLGQQQSDIALSLISEPIEEFNATAEGSGFAAHDGQRVNKRTREI